ncbi:MAG: peptidoglycan DD-metalloendopeptidase family protein [Methylococcales bacterium]|nr:peptidoglycan DD-metalloendopeptidase family protein [Methylococcales bacterium]
MKRLFNSNDAQRLNLSNMNTSLFLFAVIAGQTLSGCSGPRNFAPVRPPLKNLHAEDSDLFEHLDEKPQKEMFTQIEPEEIDESIQRLRDGKIDRAQLEDIRSDKIATVSQVSAGSDIDCTPKATDKSQQHQTNAAQPKSYVVQLGETLYSIGVKSGVHYKLLAKWNGIPAPYHVDNEQVIALVKPKGSTSQKIETAVVSKPEVVVSEVSAESEIVIASSDAQEVKPKAMVSVDKNSAITGDLQSSVVTSQANNEINKPNKDITKQPVTGVKIVENEAENRDGSHIVPQIKRDKSQNLATQSITEKKMIKSLWQWPLAGKVIKTFSQTGKSGIEISGKVGQNVKSIANGKVVYSGSGLQGYGRLVIIKHSETYLSAYAQNRKLLVKEGDAITAGQNIAEIGENAFLHFEMRKNGNPVDPLRHLPEK